MDGQTLAFRDGSFDAVICQLGLMFLPDPATALREWTRVLRRSGRLAVCVWAAPERVPLFGSLMGELSRYFPEERALLYQPSAFADAHTLERLLARAELKAIRLTRESRAHRFKSFDEYWQPFEAGGGRHGQLFVRLPAAARQTVREDVRKRMAPFFVDGELEIQADVLFGPANDSDAVRRRTRHSAYVPFSRSIARTAHHVGRREQSSCKDLQAGLRRRRRAPRRRIGAHAAGWLVRRLQHPGAAWRPGTPEPGGAPGDLGTRAPSV